MKLSDYKTGDRVDDIPLLVKSSAVAKAKNGKYYMEAELTDGVTSIRTKCWDFDPSREYIPPPGTVSLFSGRMEEYNGTPQFIIVTILPPTPGQDNPAAYMPYAPRPAEEMLDEIRAVVRAMRDDEIRRVVGKLVGDAVAALGFTTAPASQKLHHAEIGGLLHHITDTLKVARALAEVYPWLDPDMLNAGVIIHDIGKLRELYIAPIGLAEDYTTEGRLLGHLVLGVRAVREAAAHCAISGEKSMLLEHMVCAHHGFREFGSPVQPQTPEALALHLIDSLDAKMFQAAEALKDTKPGAFSAKIYALDNRQMYKQRKD